MATFTSFLKSLLLKTASEVSAPNVSAATGTLPVANGGTGAVNAANARTALSAAASGANSDITSLAGLATPLSVAQGGTGALTLTGALVGNGTSAVTAGTLSVANGGTGVASLTAYGPVIGGTTSTGAVQSVAVGTAGQVLTSNGAGAAATFQDAAAGGAVYQKNAVEMWDDFLGQPTSSAFAYPIPFTTNAAGTGAASGIFGSAASGETGGYFGIWGLETGTDTTGNAYIRGSTNGILLANGEQICEFRVKLSAVSDGTDTYIFRAGLSDATTAAPTDGVFFRYTHSVNSGAWVLVATQNTTETAVNSTSGVVAGGTWYRLRVVVNAAATSAEFFVDDVSVGTVSENIPTGSGRETCPGSNLVKSAGTTTRKALLDYCYLKYTPTGGR